MKKDLFSNKDECISEYDALKKELREGIFKVFNTEKKYTTQAKSDPIQFIPLLMKMSLEIESKGHKTFNVFPLRKNNVPKYIKLDTTTIVHLFLGGDKKLLTKGNCKKKQFETWSKIFKTNKTIFRKKGYRFAGEVSTDGFACTILFIKENYYNPTGKNKSLRVRKPYGFSDEQYINEIFTDKREEIKGKKVVGIDPGKQDLIYCVSYTEEM